MKVTDETGCVISAPGNTFYQLSVNTNAVYSIKTCCIIFFFFLVQSEHPLHQHCSLLSASHGAVME